MFTKKNGLLSCSWQFEETKKSRDYWEALDQEIRAYTAKEGMMYTRDDDLHRSPFGKPPVICNYFYHEEVRKSAKKGK